MPTPSGSPGDRSSVFMPGGAPTDVKLFVVKSNKQADAVASPVIAWNGSEPSDSQTCTMLSRIRSETVQLETLVKTQSHVLIRFMQSRSEIHEADIPPDPKNLTGGPSVGLLQDVASDEEEEPISEKVSRELHNIKAELYDTEYDYLRVLTIFCSDYLRPPIDHPKLGVQLCNVIVLQHLLHQVQILQKYNKLLFNKLVARTGGKQDLSRALIGELFTELKPALGLYVKYIADVHTYMEFCADSISTDSALEVHVNKVVSTSQSNLKPSARQLKGGRLDLSFSSMVMSPVQRIIKYKLLFERLECTLQKVHSSYFDSELKAVKQVLEYMSTVAMEGDIAAKPWEGTPDDVSRDLEMCVQATQPSTPLGWSSGGSSVTTKDRSHNIFPPLWFSFVAEWPVLWMSPTRLGVDAAAQQQPLSTMLTSSAHHHTSLGAQQPHHAQQSQQQQQHHTHNHLQLQHTNNCHTPPRTPPHQQSHSQNHTKQLSTQAKHQPPLSPPLPQTQQQQQRPPATNPAYRGGYQAVVQCAGSKAMQQHQQQHQGCIGTTGNPLSPNRQPNHNTPTANHRTTPTYRTTPTSNHHITPTNRTTPTGNHHITPANCTTPTTASNHRITPTTATSTTSTTTTNSTTHSITSNTSSHRITPQQHQLHQHPSQQQTESQYFDGHIVLLNGVLMLYTNQNSQDRISHHRICSHAFELASLQWYQAEHSRHIRITGPPPRTSSRLQTESPPSNWSASSSFRRPDSAGGTSQGIHHQFDSSAHWSHNTFSMDVEPLFQAADEEATQTRSIVIVFYLDRHMQQFSDLLKQGIKKAKRSVLI